MSLFVSARGDYLAVASGNQLTILQKDDEYQEPVGIFTCKIYLSLKLNVKILFMEIIVVIFVSL